MGLAIPDKLWDALTLIPAKIQYLIKGIHEDSNI